MVRHPELHNKNTYLRELILGGQDGLVNVLGIILGITAANGTHPVIVAASLAAAFAEAVSMGAVNYTSTFADKDHYEKEKQVELKELEDNPDEEKQEIREIYAKKGFKGGDLEKIVEVITKDKNVWVNVMMDEELHMQVVDTKKLVKESVYVGLSTVVGSIIPVLPFFIFQPAVAVPVSILISGIALFIVGVYEAKIYVGNWFRNGLKMLVIGMSAAVIGFIIGKIFHVD